MSQADPEGPPDPDPPPASGSGEAAIVHVGGPWFEVDGPDGPERVRGREAAEALAATSSVEAEEVEATTHVVETGESAEYHTYAPVGVTVSESFSGPAIALTLDRDPVPETVVVERHDGHQVPTSTQGRQVTRDGGHFGRGRWTVQYQAR